MSTASWDRKAAIDHLLLDGVSIAEICQQLGYSCRGRVTLERFIDGTCRNVDERVRLLYNAYPRVKRLKADVRDELDAAARSGDTAVRREAAIRAFLRQGASLNDLCLALRNTVPDGDDVKLRIDQMLGSMLCTKERRERTVGPAERSGSSDTASSETPSVDAAGVARRTLKQVLNDEPPQSLAEALTKAQSFLRQILVQLRTLHGAGKWHGSLRASACEVADDGVTVRLTDPAANKWGSAVGDIYDLGRLARWLLAWVPADRQQRDHYDLLLLLLREPDELDLAVVVTPLGADFVEQCLSCCSGTCPTADELLRHPFLAGAVDVVADLGESESSDCGISSIGSEGPEAVQHSTEDEQLIEAVDETADEIEVALRDGNTWRLDELLRDADDEVRTAVFEERRECGRTLLQLAGAIGDVHMIAVLIRHGAVVDVGALCCAAARNHRAALEKLLDASAPDVLHQTHEGLTPVQHAYGDGRVDCVQLLTQRGATLSARDKLAALAGIATHDLPVFDDDDGDSSNTVIIELTSVCDCRRARTLLRALLAPTPPHASHLVRCVHCSIVESAGRPDTLRARLAPPGPRLHDRLHDGPLGADAIADVMLGVARALQWLHTPRGLDKAYVLHLNVSLSTIYVADDGAVQLGGLEHAILTWSRTVPSGTREGRLVTPEELQWKLVDRASDVFGLGVVVAKLLERLQDDGGDGEKLLMLRELCSRCTLEDDDERPSAADIVEALSAM